ncbi:effector-associated domain EAD1-containing protein [Scytonema sp. UIC 10036]|uniref:effector-associated domain EAD1-containing protein n=1 Tax=Scytonema sp. UIC 10036 TaxID=2304196 RepID=UPI00140F7450|nr:effector-associated domain EAD1-containing protein [Scytonema sp. UIC 10036]
MTSNPFDFTRDALPKDFVGRWSFVHQRVEEICSPDRKSLGIIGGRLFGKTSILKVIGHELWQRMQQVETTGFLPLPLYLSLKEMVEEPGSSSDIIRLMDHKLCVTASTLANVANHESLQALGLSLNKQQNLTTTSLEHLEATINEVAEVAARTIGQICAIFLIDDIDEVHCFNWARRLYNNLRILVNSSAVRDYVCLVVTRSGRRQNIEEPGSQLFDLIDVHFLEPLDDEGVDALLSQAPDLMPEVCAEIRRQSGGHPFILKYVLNQLVKSSLSPISPNAVKEAIELFYVYQAKNLDKWWTMIGEEGRQVYYVLRNTNDWQSLHTVVQSVNNLTIDAQEGLKSLCYHGFAVHDKIYQNYRVNGELFRIWSMKKYQLSPINVCEVKHTSSLRQIVQMLTRVQYKNLQNVLLSAFPSEENLTQMVRFGLNENLAAIAGGRNLTENVFYLIQWAESEGRTEELIIAARNEKPRNAMLREVAEQLLLAPVEPEEGAFERLVLKSVRFNNVAQWREWMGMCELAICQIRIPGITVGTGFLVGVDLVMTNYHVISSAHHNPSISRMVTLRFDYKTDKGGLADEAKVQKYYLARDDQWLVDYSPQNELDYALLRVRNTPGEQPIGGQEGAPPRGWLTPHKYTFGQGEPLVILQHPKAAPLKISIGSVIYEQVGHYYVSYSANTDEGSSGAPCFNSDWNLVAIHHYGDSRGNRGVIFSHILEHMHEKGTLQLLINS